jgi:hypothetical protein
MNRIYASRMRRNKDNSRKLRLRTRSRRYSTSAVDFVARIRASGVYCRARPMG